MIKADRAELCHSVVFWTWSHHIHPCFRCFRTGRPNCNMKEFQSVSALAPQDSVACVAACRKAEVQVAIANRRQLETLLGHMANDKRKDGVGGRALMADIAAFGLQKEGSLEPSLSNPDIGGIDVRRDFPFDLMFLRHLQVWRHTEFRSFTDRRACRWPCWSLTRCTRCTLVCSLYGLLIVCGPQLFE